MSSAKNIDRSLWLAYCKTVQNAVGGLPGHKPALFFTRKAQKAPVASDNIDPAYTNYGIYSIVNNLLQDNDLFYDPTRKRTYVQGLLEYLESVDLGTLQSTTQTQYSSQRKDFDEILSRALKERERALKEFETEAELGVSRNESFGAWCAMNSPAYVQAQKLVESRAESFKAVLKQVGGPAAGRLSDAIAKIMMALFGDTLREGLAMPACRASAKHTRSLINSNTPPAAVSYVPEFEFPQYVAKVEHWVGNVGDGDLSTELLVSDGKTINESDFGHVATNGFSYGPWISFSSDGKAPEQGISFEGVDVEHKIDVQFTYDEIQSVAFHSGRWDVPSPGRLYKLGNDASQEAKNFVTPHHLVVVRNLGFKIAFNDFRLSRQVDVKYQAAKAGGGLVWVLGIPATPDGNAEESTEDAAHVAEWDSSGSLLIRPTADAGFASIVALVGEPNVVQ
ncbi:hypothetical protein ACJ41O_003123 [Fusarium nematophilum]